MEATCLKVGCNHTFLELRGVNVGGSGKYGGIDGPAERCRCLSIGAGAGVLELWPGSPTMTGVAYLLVSAVSGLSGAEGSGPQTLGQGLCDPG